MRVFFYQRSTHRKRQQETVEHCPSGIEVLRPDNITFVKDTVLSVRKRDKKLNLKSKIARFVPLNMHKMPNIANQADYIYTWGCIPRGTKKPYVLEMDNPYCICYYNMFWFNKLKYILRRLLLSRRLQHIVCISEACRKSIEAEFGEKVASKVRVVYPYIEKHRRDISKTHKNVEFLFVSTQFYLKGGRETVEAFKIIYENCRNVHLTVVTHVAEVPDEYKNFPFVQFVEANLNKEVLHCTYFSRADVFILPSYQDSFGMVYLEALSFGLPIIATNMYAIPEMVINGVNGILVDSPVNYFLDNYKINPRYVDGIIINDIMKNGIYEHTVEELVVAINCLLDENCRDRMSKASEDLFEQKFDKNVRDQSFKEVFFG